MEFIVDLKPQDVLVLFKQVALGDRSWTYATLGASLQISASQVHRSVRRCIASGLAIEKSRGEWQTVRRALLEFAVHGVRYAFPAVLGGPTRGLPTAFGVPPLSAQINSLPGTAPVWPHANGTARGPSLMPLSSNAPDAALADPAVYTLLALQDALRMGRARERDLAAAHMERLILGSGDAR